MTEQSDDLLKQFRAFQRRETGADQVSEATIQRELVALRDELQRREQRVERQHDRMPVSPQPAEEARLRLLASANVARALRPTEPTVERDTPRADPVTNMRERLREARAALLAARRDRDTRTVESVLRRFPDHDRGMDR